MIRFCYYRKSIPPIHNTFVCLIYSVFRPSGYSRFRLRGRCCGPRDCDPPSGNGLRVRERRASVHSRDQVCRSANAALRRSRTRSRGPFRGYGGRSCRRARSNQGERVWRSRCGPGGLGPSRPREGAGKPHFGPGTTPPGPALQSRRTRRRGPDVPAFLELLVPGDPGPLRSSRIALREWVAPDRRGRPEGAYTPPGALVPGGEGPLA